MLITWLSKNVDTLVSLDMIGSARFAIQDQLENKQHFLLKCPAYKLLREDFILKLEKVGINMINVYYCKIDDHLLDLRLACEKH